MHIMNAEEIIRKFLSWVAFLHGKKYFSKLYHVNYFDLQGAS